MGGIGPDTGGNLRHLVELVGARLAAVQWEGAVEPADLRMRGDQALDETHQRVMVLVPVGEEAVPGDGDDRVRRGQFDVSGVVGRVHQRLELGLRGLAEGERRQVHGTGEEGHFGALTLSGEAEIDGSAVGVGERVDARSQGVVARGPLCHHVVVVVVRADVQRRQHSVRCPHSDGEGGAGRGVPLGRDEVTAAVRGGQAQPLGLRRGECCGADGGGTGAGRGGPGAQQGRGARARQDGEGTAAAERGRGRGSVHAYSLRKEGKTGRRCLFRRGWRCACDRAIHRP